LTRSIRISLRNTRFSARRMLKPWQGKQFSLINEQLIAKNLIWGKIRRSIKHGKKSVVIVQGGPGTGKSVIALNVLAEIAARKHTALFVCKSKPFREGLQKLVGGKARNLFVNPYFLVPARVGGNNLDVVLVDEAHRLEKSNVHRYMRPEHRSGLPQVDQIIRTAKPLFFSSTTGKASGSRRQARHPM